MLTFGHVGELVFTHGLESGSLELALELGRDAEEVDCKGEDANDACENSEELGGGHGIWICKYSMAESGGKEQGVKCVAMVDCKEEGCASLYAGVLIYVRWTGPMTSLLVGDTRQARGKLKASLHRACIQGPPLAHGCTQRRPGEGQAESGACSHLILRRALGRISQNIHSLTGDRVLLRLPPIVRASELRSTPGAVPRP
jgi:hypothetical protein